MKIWLVKENESIWRVGNRAQGLYRTMHVFNKETRKWKSVETDPSPYSYDDNKMLPIYARVRGGLPVVTFVDSNYYEGQRDQIGFARVVTRLIAERIADRGTQDMLMLSLDPIYERYKFELDYEVEDASPPQLEEAPPLQLEC
jgi:hypothetical protein